MRSTLTVAFTYLFVRAIFRFFPGLFRVVTCWSAFAWMLFLIAMTFLDLLGRTVFGHCMQILRFLTLVWFLTHNTDLLSPHIAWKMRFWYSTILLTNFYAEIIKLQFVESAKNLIFHRKGEPSVPHMLPILRLAVGTTASPCIRNIYGTEDSCKTRVS